MIKLDRQDIPEYLANNQKRWTEELLRAVEAGATISAAAQSRYSHKKIKEPIVEHTRGKCAYCECHVRHNQHGDVEHIRPKSKVPELTFVWENLTLACSLCNGEKGTYDDQTLPLVNPYEESPEAVLGFVGPVLRAIDLLDRRARTTIATLDLNRNDLVLRRVERIEALNKLLIAWAGAPHGGERDALWKEVQRACTDGQEFSGALKAELARVQDGLKEVESDPMESEDTIKEPQG